MHYGTKETRIQTNIKYKVDYWYATKNEVFKEYFVTNYYHTYNARPKSYRYLSTL